MNKRIQERFIYGVAVILFVTAAVILLSATGKTHTLDQPDSLLFLSDRQVFCVTGALELALSAFLLMGRSSQAKLALIAWLATNFLVYQIGLQWNATPNFFVCLGNLSRWFPIEPRLLDVAVFVILGFLIAGSYGFLILDWLNNRKAVKTKSVKSTVSGAQQSS